MNTLTELSREINRVLAEEGITQEALASLASVSQPTVSRAKRGEPLRNSKARARLVRYMQQYSSSRMPRPASAALQEVWDGTDEHAIALAALLRASRELWPDLKGEDPDHKR